MAVTMALYLYEYEKVVLQEYPSISIYSKMLILPLMSCNFAVQILLICSENAMLLVPLVARLL